MRRGVGSARSSHEIPAFGTGPPSGAFAEWRAFVCSKSGSRYPLRVDRTNGCLFLVATPIGNLGDVSLRAKQTLSEVDRILAEDTRHTARLLARLGVTKPLLSFHEHNERSRIARVLAELATGARIALVSDAGTPAISDPGTRLVREARRAGILIESVPGPSSLASALAASGFPAAPSVFLGFPPSRSGARRRWIAPWAAIPATLVFYEAPHRLEPSLADLCELLGADRPAILLREMSKLHEEGIDGTLGSILEEVRRRSELAGEIVLVVAPPELSSASSIECDGTADAPSLRDRFDQLIASGLDRAKALRMLARECGLPRSEAWRRLHRDGEP